MKDNLKYIEKLLQGAEVEWKTLGEVCEIIRGVRVTKKDLLEDGKYPVVSGGTGYMGYINEYNREENTITIAQYGTAGYVKWQTEKFWANDICYSVKPNNEVIINRYLYFHIVNKQQHLYDISNRTATPYSIERDKILNIQIPIPPLEVQAEIVRILDTFTEHTAELIAELTNENIARKKQYNYYREQLLTASMVDDKWLMNNEEVEWKSLGEVTEIKRGRRLVKSQLEETGKYAVYQNSMVPLGFYHESNVKADTTYIICGGAAGEIGFSDVDFWAADDISYFVTPSNFNSKFLYYFLLTKQTKISSQVRRASVPRLSKTAFEKIQIPIPSLEEQERIVSILDKFDTLTTSISEGLPKEIELRKKQYEYYREQLLTF